MKVPPPNLPDERTARRLLDLLAQVEESAKSRPAVAAAVIAGEESAELRRLRAENAELKKRQRQAFERINALVARIEEFADQSPLPEAEVQQLIQQEGLA